MIKPGFTISEREGARVEHGVFDGGAAVEADVAVAGADGEQVLDEVVGDAAGLGGEAVAAGLAELEQLARPQ